MPIQVTYPGVYVQELPSGTHTIAPAPTSICAFVGYLRRGPINTPIQCFNFGDFQRVFGGLDAESVTSFQVSQFFVNGGSEAWVSRICAASAPPVQPRAALVGAPSSGSVGGGALTLTPGTTLVELDAANPGTWGEDIFVTVDYLTSAPNSFNLTATEYAITGSSSASVVRTQRCQAVTLDSTQPNALNAVIRADPNDALLATPTIPDNLPVAIPFASGTILSVTVPQTPVTASITVTVQAPASESASPPPPVEVTLALTDRIATLNDLVAAIQRAVANAGAVLRYPALASAQVRPCLSPFVPSSGTRAQLVQLRVSDPRFADYLVGIACDPPSLFGTLSVNYQAQRLRAPTPIPANPDGLPPTGADIAGDASKHTGIHALAAMPIVNLIVVPDLARMDAANYRTAATATLDYALARTAFAILDMPQAVATPTDAVAWGTSAPATFGKGTISGATYWPQVQVPTPYAPQPMSIGGSGTMAGVYAQTDASRGVWKAPAGISTSLAGVQGLTYVMNDQENGGINVLGINAMRHFPTYGNVAWGARTLASTNAAAPDWKYIPVRRLALYIEQSLTQGLQWVVFEPNSPVLWAQIRLSVEAFLHLLFQQGAFVGTTPAQAYAVKCDASTTTAADIAAGLVNVVILFAPVKPAEFIVIQLALRAAAT